MVSLESFIDIILPIALWSWCRPSLQQKWVPGVFAGGKKRPVRKADNLTTILGYCHVIWESSLPGNLWAPRSCNGTDLSFLLGGGGRTFKVLRFGGLYSVSFLKCSPILYRHKTCLFAIRRGPQSVLSSDTNSYTCVISDFHRDVDQICALQGCHTEYNGNSLSAFRSTL